VDNDRLKRANELTSRINHFKKAIANARVALSTDLRAGHTIKEFFVGYFARNELIKFPIAAEVGEEHMRESVENMLTRLAELEKEFYNL